MNGRINRDDQKKHKNIIDANNYSMRNLIRDVISHCLKLLYGSCVSDNISIEKLQQNKTEKMEYKEIST